MKVVVALGGNALLRRGQPVSVESQRSGISEAAAAIAELSDRHDIVVTHGNGPQIGLLALQAEAAQGAPCPLDILGAESQGMIGYLIEQALQNRLPSRTIATLLTRVEVNAADPAFRSPTKPIGPIYTRDQADALAKATGWTVAPEGPHWRRVVASPEPLRVLELPAIRLLLDAGAIVICAGGGGIPVAATQPGMMCGMEAVIDKDLSSALLAHELGADALLMLTDVDAAYADWRTAREHPIANASPEVLRRMDFAPGSMGPKVEAACRFVDSGGGVAMIGRVEDAAEILKEHRGTIVKPRPCANGGTFRPQPREGLLSA